MPTGLHNSIDPVLGHVGGLVSAQPRKAINHTVNFTIGADSVPQNLPGLIVEPGLSVALRGISSRGINDSVVRVALNAETLTDGGGRVITPDTEISFPVDHLAQIWAMGKKADGLVVTISGVPVG